MRTNRAFVTAFAAAFLMALPVWAADPTNQPGAPHPQAGTTPTQDGAAQAHDSGKVIAVKTMQASKLTGLNVRNKQGEELGTVNDMVIDVSDGRVAYIALSVGGVLGVGDKLFAVPFEALQFKHGRDEQFFVMDMDAQKLKAAPGFDEDHWPDFADPEFRQKVDNYYRENRAKVDTATSAPRR